MDYETPEKHQAAPSSATGADLSLCSHDTPRRQKRHIFHKFVNITASRKSGEKISGIRGVFFQALLRVTGGSWESDCCNKMDHRLFTKQDEMFIFGYYGDGC